MLANNETRQPAALMLEDGTFFLGTSCGAPGEAFGEICFNTSLVGYLEVLSDPSYAGQIITMTYPQIGNYGVARADLQRDTLALRGLVVHDMCYTPSNFRSELSLPDFLAEQGVVAIQGIDTRALTRHIRDNGAMRAGIFVLEATQRDRHLCHQSSELQQSQISDTSACPPVSPGGVVDEGAAGDALNSPPLEGWIAPKAQDGVVDTQLQAQLLKRVQASPSIVGQNLASTVSITEPYSYTDDPTPYEFLLKPAAEPRFKVVAYDCGAKHGILRNLVRAGCEVTVVPWDAPAASVLAMNPDGVFFSNGPGDPEPVEATFEAVRGLFGKVPVFGICLGHQMLALAAGSTIEKLKFGHRGGNHPVMNLLTRGVEITAQNHGFGIVFSSLGELLPDESAGVSAHPAGNDMRFWVEKGVAPVVQNPHFGRIQLTHVNLNDGTPEGIAFLDIPAFCVQYHPEASPGPTDSHYLFTAFTRLMEGRSDYLDIDISQDRLSEWK